MSSLQSKVQTVQNFLPVSRVHVINLEQPTTSIVHVHLKKLTTSIIHVQQGAIKHVLLKKDSAEFSKTTKVFEMSTCLKIILSVRLFI